MIGCISWILAGVAIYFFMSVDWRLGVGLVLALVSIAIDFADAIQELREFIERVNRKIG